MQDPNPATVIIAELSRRLGEKPFEPFVIVMSNGSRHEVPTPDHCTVAKLSRRVTVDHDDGSFVVLNAVQINQIELLQNPAA